MSEVDDASLETHFVRRMRELRQARGWSQERLAQEIAQRTGFKLNAPAITKMEWALDPDRADKARRLGFEEAWFIADTLETKLETMTEDDVDAKLYDDIEANRLSRRWTRAVEDLRRAAARYEVVRYHVTEFLAGHPDYDDRSNPIAEGNTQLRDGSDVHASEFVRGIDVQSTMWTLGVDDDDGD